MSTPDERWFYEVKGGTGGPENLSAEEKRGHPASRPGSGTSVVWRNEPHRVSPWMRCLCCGWYQDEFYAGVCACGAYNWVNMSPEPSVPPRQSVQGFATQSAGIDSEPRPAGIERPHGIDAEPRPLGGDGSRRLIIDQYPGSAIAMVLGGIARGMVVMLVGAAGVGKSTLAAQAGYTIAQHLGERLYWLDADQLKEELIEEAFVRAQCPPGGLEGGIIPLHEEDEDGMPDFRRACARVPEHGVLVVGSLEAWAPRGDKQALELLRVLRAHPARVKLVVAATNAAGGVAGAGELERAGDATVFVDRVQIRVGKCRWTIGTTWARCGAGGLDVERLGDTGMPAPSRGAANPPALGVEPDFSIEFIEMAGQWSVREVEAYRARLRAQGVPRDSLFGWDRAVAEWKSLHAGLPSGAAQAQPSEEAPLSESTGAAYARLMRSWPWKKPVRASDIARDLLTPGFDELSGALRELLGASEGATLSATEVGNALKAVRDVSLDGRKLTRELDRKAIARWRLASCDVA
jgi:hypothetical protein